MKKTPVEILAIDDAHWYRNSPKSKYLPSVSAILGQFKDGLEYVSPYELKQAQERGVRVHSATEQLEQENSLVRGFYSEKEWGMIAGFVSWWEDTLPEKTLFSEKMLVGKKYGGSLDRVYQIDGKKVLIDIKTTSAIYDKHWLQVAAYATLVEKTENMKIDEVAILRLTDKTKKRYQYEARSREEWMNDYSVFEKMLNLWHTLNPDKQPKISDLPDVLSLTKTPN